MSDRKSIFVVGMDEFNRQVLERIPLASECDFYSALDYGELRGDEIDVSGLLDRATRNIERVGKVDGICSFYDYPGTTMVPILNERFGLRGPSLQSVLACEHKYWSRLEQQKVIPEHIPQFRAFDPFDDDAFESIDFPPPFWVKPIKSFRSFLAFRINSKSGFESAMRQIRKHIEKINSGFRYVMEQFGGPMELVQMQESCLAETPLAGAQCTLEGYVLDGNVVGYGFVDSVRGSDRSSLSRYEYPSSLPLEVQHRMIDVARRALAKIGLDHTVFNIEFFYDRTADQVYLLEINPRCSQSHAGVFERVHGISHFNTMVSVALGRRPRPMEKAGGYNVAAHFMLRVFEDGFVQRVPHSDDVERLRAEMPESELRVLVDEGIRLEDLSRQDSYSYELANLLLGARDQAELVERYQRALEILPFEVEVRRLAQIH
jgi:hypothetical protein